MSDTVTARVLSLTNKRPIAIRPAVILSEGWGVNSLAGDGDKARPAGYRADRDKTAL